MLETIFSDRATIERLRGGLFGPHLDSFVATRRQLGYARATMRQQLRLLDDLERWLNRNSLALVDLHEATGRRFLADRRSKGYRRNIDVPALSTTAQWTKPV